MPPDAFNAVVIGAGPVGLMSALELSKTCKVAIITNRFASNDDPPRVESVPAQVIALLIEFGIHPKQIGVDRLHESRLAAWDKQVCNEIPAPVTAHVERPALDVALFTAAVRTRRIEFILSNQPREALSIITNKSTNVIDASGRRAVTAKRRIQPTRPWVAKTFWVRKQDCLAMTKLRIAALTGGYVYRLGAMNCIGIGIVGRGDTLRADPSRLERNISEQGADWVLEGLPSLAEMSQGITMAASVQWTEGDEGVRIGSARLAHDALSSQGLATGLSDALYAASMRDKENDHSFISARQTEQRLSHLDSMARVIANCRFANSYEWSEYAQFVSSYLSLSSVPSRTVLKDGHVRPSTLSRP
jgi:flavin-dependent dehydrogenase